MKRDLIRGSSVEQNYLINVGNCDRNKQNRSRKRIQARQGISKRFYVKSYLKQNEGSRKAFIISYVQTKFQKRFLFDFFRLAFARMSDVFEGTQ